MASNRTLRRLDTSSSPSLPDSTTSPYDPDHTSRFPSSSSSSSTMAANTMENGGIPSSSHSNTNPSSGQDVLHSPITTSAEMGYPTNLKSRGVGAVGGGTGTGTPGTSPVLGGRVVDTRSGGSNGSIGSSSIAPPTKSSSSSSSRHPLSLRGTSSGSFTPKLLLSSRTPTRLSRLGVVVLLVVVLWLGFGRQQEKVVREKLTTRWWEDDSFDKRLLPKPRIVLPKRPTPSPLSPPPSHTHSQLLRLPSTYSTSSPPDYTFILLLSTPSHLPLLSSLLPSLLSQSLPPSRILLLSPSGLIPQSSYTSYGPSITHLPYVPTLSPSLALLNSLKTISTSYLLLLTSPTISTLPQSYAQTLLRTSCTPQYSSSILSTSGLLLSPSSSSCLTSLSTTHRTTLPTSPFLLQTTWLSHLSNGFRTDLPVEVAIAMGLWTKVGVESWALPLSAEGDGEGGEVGCERVRRALEGKKGEIGRLRRLFGDEGGAGGGLRGREGGLLKGVNEEEEKEEEGVVVVLLSGDEEVELAWELLCGLAGEKKLRVLVADSEKVRNGERVGGGVGEEDGERKCLIDLRPLGNGGGGGGEGIVEVESISLSLVEELDRLDRVEVVMFLVDGDRGREFMEVMKWHQGVFGVGQGGKRRTRKMAEEENGTVVIPLRREEVGYADWISALSIKALRHWHTPKIDLTVVTNNRPESLHRLLTALQTSHYYGDDISLSINLEQTADRATQHLVDELDWPFGTITLRHRIVLGGLMPAIVESWYPTSNDSYGVFLEDDVEVSPLFYGWLKLTILHYRYSSREMFQQSSRMFGISLYQQKNIETRPEGRQPFDAHSIFSSLSLDPTTPYLSQIPCSWGAAYFPEIWREFHQYLSLRLSETSLPISEPIVPAIKSNGWPRSWKKYFIELVYMRGYVMLYPNYPDFYSLSTNHMEKGTHIHVNKVDLKRKIQFEVPLMTLNHSLLSLPSGSLPTWEALPLVDLWGSIASGEEVVERGWQSVKMLDSCEKMFRVDDGMVRYDARELLCRKRYEKVERLVEAQSLKGGTGRLGKKVVVPTVVVEEPIVRPEIVEHPDKVVGGGGVGGGAVGEAREARARARDLDEEEDDVHEEAHRREDEALDVAGGGGEEWVRERQREEAEEREGGREERIDPVQDVPRGEEAEEVERRKERSEAEEEALRRRVKVGRERDVVGK